MQVRLCFLLLSPWASSGQIPRSWSVHHRTWYLLPMLCQYQITLIGWQIQVPVNNFSMVFTLGSLYRVLSQQAQTSNQNTGQVYYLMVNCALHAPCCPLNPQFYYFTRIHYIHQYLHLNILDNKRFFWQDSACIRLHEIMDKFWDLAQTQRDSNPRNSINF